MLYFRHKTYILSNIFSVRFKETNLILYMLHKFFINLIKLNKVYNMKRQTIYNMKRREYYRKYFRRRSHFNYLRRRAVLKQPCHLEFLTLLFMNLCLYNILSGLQFCLDRYPRRRRNFFTCCNAAGGIPPLLSTFSAAIVSK